MNSPKDTAGSLIVGHPYVPDPDFESAGKMVELLARKSFIRNNFKPKNSTKKKKKRKKKK